jgi:hypothetical protein
MGDLRGLLIFRYDTLCGRDPLRLSRAAIAGTARA